MKRSVRLFALLALVLIGINPALAARVTHTAKTPPALNAGALSANAADFTFTAADATNKEEVVHTGREFIVAHNTSVDTAYTVTVTSVAVEGRTLDVPNAYSMAAGEYAIFGPYPVKGWRQTNGKLYFEASNAAIEFAVIKIPTSFVP